MNDALVIYCPKISPRLEYTLDWIFTEQLKLDYRITTDTSELESLSFFVSYGRIFENALTIPDKGLLWETGIRTQNIDTGNWNKLPVLFATTESKFSAPFDIFSAIFFLLSRYEEYYSYNSDKHNRYPATDSILFKNGLLERPIVDEWVHQFCKVLTMQFNISVPLKKFSFTPTYDIDIAYSYRAKGLLRTTGAFLKDLSALRIDKVSDRLHVLQQKKLDPYDSFDKLKALHSKQNIVPIYFILASQRTTAFDKNISPNNAKMQRLIRGMVKEGRIGLHPSYYTDKDGYKLASEKSSLEKICGKHIVRSRQHYIKIVLPDTYRNLLSQKIFEDYSMGYATHLGFRAGTGQCFCWYDLQNEITTALRIYPFCFMDTTALYEMKLDRVEAFNRLKIMTGILKATDSLLITIFHNFSLGSSPEWNGWADAYFDFVRRYY